MKNNTARKLRQVPPGYLIMRIDPHKKIHVTVAMPQHIRIMTPLFNTFGTVALVGGAIYSAWFFWRRRMMRHRVISNVLIAAGAILPAIGGTHFRLTGNLQILYVSELLGIIIIFIGFLRSREILGLYRFPLIHGFRKVSTN